jgi:hypothetical protein
VSAQWLSAMPASMSATAADRAWRAAGVLPGSRRAAVKASASLGVVVGSSTSSWGQVGAGGIG